MFALGRKRTFAHLCSGTPIVAPPAAPLYLLPMVRQIISRAITRVREPGASVIIDHGQGEYSLFAHLQAASVAVKTGQRVAVSDAVGSCGNSDLPYLPDHLGTGPAYQESLGLPTFFNGYLLGGRLVGRGEPRWSE
jgi:murein DD-endopeptidase MepM/ murein hydrolase activator NlpD